MRISDMSLLLLSSARFQLHLSAPHHPGLLPCSRGRGGFGDPADITPDRHGTWVDAIEKMVGGAAGIFFTKGVIRFMAGKPS